MNLVLIGKFLQEQDAEKVEDVMKQIGSQAEKDECFDIAHAGLEGQRFTEEMLKLLMKLNVHSLAPIELGQLYSDFYIEREQSQITLRTDEADVSAFIKLFVDAGAKVEVFSAHDYPTDSDDIA